jgi:formamidopyrimidine-DNA glycosylase
MPELPEVETMRRGIESIVGWRILRIDCPPCSRRPISIRPSLQQIRRRIEGQAVQAIDRLGKRIILWVTSKRTTSKSPGDEALVIEPRMTGLVLIGNPPTTDHVRLRLQLSKGKRTHGKASQLLFWDRRGLGSVYLLSADEIERRFSDNVLGPDALQISPAQLQERLGESRRSIKVALLDQRAVAGIGNLYASEILHLAGIDPRTQCQRLTGDNWRRLHAAMRKILHAAIRHEGSTLSDGTYRNALNQNGGYQNHHRVYDRADQPCRTCKSPIRRIVQAQRSTFFCPSCQRVKK